MVGQMEGKPVFFSFGKSGSARELQHLVSATTNPTAEVAAREPNGRTVIDVLESEEAWMNGTDIADWISIPD